MGTVRLFQVRLGTVWLGVATLLTLMYVGTLVQYPLDFWNHLCVGRQIWDTGAIPRTDTFAYTIAGETVVYQNWLVELALYGIWRLGGCELAQLAIACCYAAAIGLTTWHAWLRSRSPRVSAGLALLSVALAASNFGVRPQALSATLFAAELLVLGRWPTRWLTPLLVGLIELVWANVHGAFPLGVVLPSLFLAGTAWTQLRRRGLSLLASGELWIYAASVLAAAAMAFVNPNPEKTLDYVFGVASRASQRQIGEWQATAAVSYTAMAFFASLPLAAAVAWCRRRDFNAVEWLLLITFAGLGFTVQRMVVWWALVLPPVLAPHLAGWLRARRGVPSEATEAAPASEGASTPTDPIASLDAEERSTGNFVLMCALLALAVMSTPWTRFYNPLLPPEKRLAHPSDEPRQVVALLAEQGFRGRVFLPVEWGSYLNWHLSPQVTGFIDSWVDFYPDEVWNDYQRIGRGDSGWDEALRRYQVDLVVWNHRLQTQLPAALAASEHWRRLYEDDLCCVYARADR